MRPFHIVVVVFLLVALTAVPASAISFTFADPNPSTPTAFGTGYWGTEGSWSLAMRTISM